MTGDKTGLRAGALVAPLSAIKQARRGLGRFLGASKDD